MADAADSKSAARECVRVRVPPPAPLSQTPCKSHSLYLIINLKLIDLSRDVLIFSDKPVEFHKFL